MIEEEAVLQSKSYGVLKLQIITQKGTGEDTVYKERIFRSSRNRKV